VSVAGERTRPAPRTAGRAASVGYSKRSRLDKLGVKPDMRVALVGVTDAAFQRELRERTEDVSVGRPRKDTDMVLFAVNGPAALARLATLQNSIKRNGSIWVLWPKGQAHIKEDTIRAAAIARGLVDVKVIAFSETLSGLKLVIPLARR
jgi:hypothetical protein